MKKEILQNNAEALSGPVALHVMISRVSISFVPSATRKCSLIVNDVPVDLHVNTDENMLATVFGSLLHTVISHSENSCIRISANLNGKMVLVNVKEDHKLNGPAFFDSLRQVQQLAQRIGGNISVNHTDSQPTTIVLSFLNLPLAA